MELENKELQSTKETNNDNSERYVRRDIEGGYLYNKSEINYFRQVQKLEVANNLMLGDYNQNGIYTLNAEMLQQLIGLTKVYQYSFGSNMFCQSLDDIEGYGKIDFAIKIVKDYPTKGKTTAILELLEPIDKANGYYTNTNTVQIDFYTAPDTNTFVIDVLKRFNIISKKDSGLVAKKHEDIDLIVARKKYEELRKNLLEEKVEIIYKNNFNKKIKLLSKSPAGKKVLEDFEKQSYKINGWFVKEGMKGYYKTMDELLQSVIEKNKPEILQDVKLVASLNKAENDCAKIFAETIASVDKTIVNAEIYGAEAVLIANNKRQLEIQNNNQNSKKEEVKIESKTAETSTKMFAPKAEEKQANFNKTEKTSANKSAVSVEQNKNALKNNIHSGNLKTFVGAFVDKKDKIEGVSKTNNQNEQIKQNLEEEMIK